MKRIPLLVLCIFSAQMAAATESAADGETNCYKGSRIACDVLGIAGTPSAGDAAAWVTSIATGPDTLYRAFSPLGDSICFKLIRLGP